MKITDEMLYGAAEDAAARWLNTLPDRAHCGHEFSPAFERAMEALLRRRKRRWRLGTALLAAAVAMLLVSGVYAGREDTYRVYAVQEDGYASYLLRPEESETPAEPHRLEPGWVPEGWELDRISEGEEYFRTVFFLPGPEEPSFTLTQYYGKDDSSVLQGAFTIRECKVGGEHALLLAAENTGLRILLWCSGPYGFQLSSSALEEGDLLRIAENLKW